MGAAVARKRSAAAVAWLKRRAWLVAIFFVFGLLYFGASRLLGVFHWAEQRVDRKSPWHMFIFFAVTLPFHLGLPIPIVHQAWAVAIGCFFRWRAFPILCASLSVGVPLPFVIGRWLARYGGDTASKREAWLRQIAPRATTYLTPLRRAIGAKPIRNSFLLMWAPLPTSSLPLLVGYLVPSSELKLTSFVTGALPSKLLHFACDVLVGIEARSLAAAFDTHDHLPGVDDLTSTPRHARAIAIGTMGMTVTFMAAMVWTMHRSLSEMNAKELSRVEIDLQDELLSPRKEPPSPRARMSEGGCRQSLEGGRMSEGGRLSLEGGRDSHAAWDIV